MGKKIRNTILSLLIMTLISGCTGDGGVETEPSAESAGAVNQSLEEEENEIKIGDKLPITRALAVKMAVMAYTDKSQLKTYDREITYADIEENQWYDKYINGAYILGIAAGNGDNTFDPEDALSLSQAQSLIDSMNPEGKTKIKLDENNKDKAISYALWCQLYRQALEEMAEEQSLEAMFDVREINFTVLASKGNNEVLPEGTVITDIGPFYCEGITADYYIDMEVTALEKGGEIIAITSIVTDEPVIKNVFISQVTDSSITVFSGGAERSYRYSGAQDIEGNLCNIKIKGDLCLGIEIISENIAGKILSVSEDSVEIAGHPVYPVSKDLKVYSAEQGTVKWKNLKNLIVGTELADFYVMNGQVCGAVIKNTPVPENIRVVIGDTEFKNLVHEKVEITATDTFTVSDGTEEKIYNKGEIFTTDSIRNGRIFISTSENGKIAVNSISRNNTVPEYRGTLEISPKENGFVIVNEVNIEEYLYSVVPSEMPASYGLEALKTQAVTARSYAYNQFYGNKFHAYGANVDDSVISQVYNNTAENAVSTQAVNETAGQCLVYNGEVISANFFSTSSGMTANNGEIWADSDTREFPAQTSPYLTSKVLYRGQDYGDLSVEENAAVFLKDWEVQGYDSHVSWFRWKTEITNEEITRSVNENLKARYEADPTLIKTLQADGTFKVRPVETIGTLVNLEVLQRGQGGNIMSMKITGTDNTIIVYTEYNIRTLIRPMKYDEGSDIVIQRKDGTELANYALMPSGYFTMERMTDGEGNILYVKFYGGGNGHGAGMSQNGAKGMVDSGMTYEEVLQFYYTDTEVLKMY